MHKGRVRKGPDDAMVDKQKVKLSFTEGKTLSWVGKWRSRLDKWSKDENLPKIIFKCNAISILIPREMFYGI